MKWLNNAFWLVVVAGLSCNEAPTGFGAPQGSTVAIKAVTTAPGEEDTFLVATITVSVPSTGDVLIPGNNIFVTVTCTTCSLFDRADGESVTVADPTRVTEVDNPYSFATNDNGTYEVVVKVENPADIGKTTYKARIVANIGVASAEAQIEVGEEAAE